MLRHGLIYASERLADAPLIYRNISYPDHSISEHCYTPSGLLRLAVRTHWHFDQNLEIPADEASLEDLGQELGLAALADLD